MWNRIQAFLRRSGRAKGAPLAVMAWYDDDQWKLLRKVSVDADRLEPAYTDWLKVADAKYEALTREGKRVAKVLVDVKDLAAWCHEMARPVDAESRAAYAMYAYTSRPQPEAPFFKFLKKRSPF